MADGNFATLARHTRFVKTRSDSGSEDVHYPFIYEDLPEEFKLVAERELNETESNRKRGLQELKEYIKENNLPVISDEPLLAVLRVCKYDMKKSKAKLKKFTVARKEVIKQMAELGMEKIQQIIDDMPFGFLPYRDKHGRAIFYTRVYAFKLESYEIQDVLNVIAGIGMFGLSYQLSSIAGFAYFVECKSPSFYLVCRIVEVVTRNLFRVLPFPVRVPSVEFLNENFVVRCGIRLGRTIISKKIAGRINIHGSDLEALHESYHPDILPEEFGGNMGPVSTEAYRQKFLEFIRDLIEELDESL